MTTPDVSSLSVQAVHATPTNVDWSERRGEDGDGEATFRYWQAFEYPVSEGSEVTLVTDSQGGNSLVLHGDVYDEWDTYVEDHTDDETDQFVGALTEDDFEGLRDVEPYEYGAEGPMMNYWYPIDESEGSYRTYDPERAAVKIVDTPLCVVQVGNEYGLALTGGGMDLSWEICEAFVALGMLPPTHFADLPRMAGKSNEDDSRLVVAAMRRSLIFERDNAQYRLERLERLAADLQEGRL